MKLSVISLLFAMLTATTVTAQSDQQLKIGMHIPEKYQFEDIKNYDGKSLSFKGKAMLLDFWATWCTSCIHNFGKMDTLQSSFANELQVLLINAKGTGDDSIKVSNFYKNWSRINGKSLQLPSLVSDTIYAKLFPTRALPHYVWIDNQGTVKAITSSYEVNERNIKSFLAGDNLDLNVKANIDERKPLFTNDYLKESSVLGYNIFLRGYLSGLVGNGRIKENKGVEYGLGFFNYDLLSLYKIILYRIDPSLQQYQSKIIFIDKADSLKLIYNKDTGISKEDWEQNNLYSIDVIVPKNQSANLNKSFLEYLNFSCGLTGQIQKRRVKVLALVSHNLERISTKGGKRRSELYNQNGTLLNAPISHLIARLNDFDGIQLPVINRTGYLKNIDIKIDNKAKTLVDLRSELKKYALDLEERMEDLSVIVIKSNPN